MPFALSPLAPPCYSLHPSFLVIGMEFEDCANALILPCRRKIRRKQCKQNQDVVGQKDGKLGKNQLRKMRRVQEEKEKKEVRDQALHTLQKYRPADDAYTFLYASGKLGQVESMREKLRRGIQLKKARLAIPSDVPLFRERVVENRDVGFDSNISPKTFLQRIKADGTCTNEMEEKSFSQLGQTKNTEAENQTQTSKILFCSGDPRIVDKIVHVNEVCKITELNQKAKRKRKQEKGKVSIQFKNTEAGLKTSKESCHQGVKFREAGVSDDLDVETKLVHMDEDEERKTKTEIYGNVSENYSNTVKSLPVVFNEKLLGSSCVADSGFIVRSDCTTSKSVEEAPATVKHKRVVPVWRIEEVEKARRNLPILMMEQEIMEAIDEHLVVIICGETGCGKTTQVPQFLYEAGYTSSTFKERSCMIGVTQPRRVAVLSTAKRVSQELNLKLGQEIGFQVRYDRKIGENCQIKFMTDGILLREVQSDFLLRKYSVIVLDEAHERSLNTDILIGMLSRILPLRQSLYEEQGKALQSGRVVSYDNLVTPLRLIIMSATLQVDDFVSNKIMFLNPPPVLQIPARQFPVNIHFSAKTELLDYVHKAFKKVCAIHKKLPPGGILVFLTGRSEVHFLCRKLRKAFSNGKKRKRAIVDSASVVSLHDSCVSVGMEKIGNGFEDLDLDGISNAMDGSAPQEDNLGYVNDEIHTDVETDDHVELTDSGSDSSSENNDDDDYVRITKPEQNEGEEEWNLQPQTLSLGALKEAFDSFSGEKLAGKNEGNKPPVSRDEHGVLENVEIYKDPRPLYVLPLYAMLPAAAQLRVFDTVPEGSRLVVVATNVAETSITIPGIRYVVDCGRAKEKDYDRASGVAKYEVRWISKASASQRAGRAGRTGPGHCYRLYSSAVFNDMFPEFSIPEINRAPIEGLVLLMKCMGINKVSNFPFPSQPDKHALLEAERCLQALAALDFKSGLLTPIGRAMAVYPISPRHSRMLLCAIQASSGASETAGVVLLAYATAVAAALSLESPFLREVETGNEDLAENLGAHKVAEVQKQVKVMETESGKSVRMNRVSAISAAHAKFQSSTSDALSVVAALRAYETSANHEEFCKCNSLHERTMFEISKLRRQLLQLIFLYSNDTCFESGCAQNLASLKSSINATDLEAMWQTTVDKNLNPMQEELLQQAICAGWADRVARKVTLHGSTKTKKHDKHHKAVCYQSCTVEDDVFLHPTSVLSKVAPEFVVYNELVSTSRLYMKGVTAVESHWLVAHASGLCTFSKPLAEPPPWYDSSSDNIMCWVSPRFGPFLWELPLQSFPMKSGKSRTATFAYALLQGKVFKCLASLRPLLAADPCILLRPEGYAHRRVIDLIDALGTGSDAIDSRRKLRSRWDTQPHFLCHELLLWVQNKYHEQFSRLWDQWKQELY